MNQCGPFKIVDLLKLVLEEASVMRISLHTLVLGLLLLGLGGAHCSENRKLGNFSGSILPDFFEFDVPEEAFILANFVIDVHDGVSDCLTNTRNRQCMNVSLAAPLMESRSEGYKFVWG